MQKNLKKKSRAMNINNKSHIDKLVWADSLQY